MKKLVATLAAGLGLIAGLAPAEAANLRFDTCVVAEGKCQEELEGGTFPKLRIIDTESTRERYEVCVKEIVGKQCFEGRMNQRGKDSIRYEPRAAGKATARWKVDGDQVGVWKYEIVLPGE